jgi:hypothetical protein
MKQLLTEKQQKLQQRFDLFSQKKISPQAAQWDRDERIEPSLFSVMAAEGYLAAHLPEIYQSSNLDSVSHGLLHASIGQGSTSLQSILVVTDMVAQAINRVGSQQQKEKYLARIVSGQLKVSFCLTEPLAGSDAQAISTKAEKDGNCFVINGEKKWITAGQEAGLYLVVASTDNGITTFLVDRDSNGLEIEPVKGLLGSRASMMANLFFKDCRIPNENRLGAYGHGFTFVVSTALDLGRYLVAWGCVGLANACLKSSTSYAAKRQQFGGPLRNNQLIQEMITNMAVEISAAQLLCYKAGRSRQSNHPDSVHETLQAKYYASRMVNRVAFDTVQIHGAQGIGDEFPVQRYFRDARAMEIIEGSTQVMQRLISMGQFRDFDY